MGLNPFRRWMSGSTVPGRGTGITSVAPQQTGTFGGRGPPGMEAGDTGRRLSVWRPSSEHVNSLLRQAGPTVTSRARWLARNNGYAKAAVRSWRSATVGAGIKPSSMIINEAQRLAVNAAWLAWTDEADAEGVTDLYGIQRRVAGEAFLAGECFVRLRQRRPQDGLTVPLQLQVMPAEQLPMDKEATAPNGNTIRMGIEFNANLKDKREAYWFYRQNPADRTLTLRDAMASNQLTRVPANEVLHVYDPGEAGQIRGLSSFGAAMVKMFHLDLYDDAELERKKQAARYAAVITKDVEATAGDEPAQLGVGAYGPGAYIELNPGEDLKFSEPSEVGGSYEPFQYRTLLAIASGLGIPYGELSHDLTKASYASSRAGLVAFRLEIEAFQHAVLVFQMLRKVWIEWMTTAILAGAIPISAGEYNRTPALFRLAKFITPKLPWVDPAKDARGEEIMVNNGWKAPSDVIESLGEDPEATYLRIARDKQLAEQLGIGPFPKTSGAAAQPPGDSGPTSDVEETDQTPEGDTSRDAPGRRQEREDAA
jgi:lambda family phage portal protein